MEQEDLHDAYHQSVAARTQGMLWNGMEWNGKCYEMEGEFWYGIWKMLRMEWNGSLKFICFTITHKKAQVGNSEKTITQSSKSTNCTFCHILL